MSYGDQLRDIANSFYRDASHSGPATAKEIARWAIRRGLWHAQPADLVDQCADELARAMREEHISDSRGRSVRVKHVARVTGPNGQSSFQWDDIRTAKPAFMAIAFQQRRQQIVGDCKQLKADVDYYNDRTAAAIQVVFDFTRDLEESEQQDVA